MAVYVHGVRAPITRALGYPKTQGGNDIPTYVRTYMAISDERKNEIDLTCTSRKYSETYSSGA